MALTIERIFRVTATDDKKVRWFVEPGLLVEVEGRTFVKLPRAGIQSGFTRLVFHGCHDVPRPLPEGFSLSASLGYRCLVALRNGKQQEDFAAAALADVPEMFRAAGEVVCKTKPRVSRTQRKEWRGKPTVITIRIPAYDDKDERPLDVLCPAHPRDDLAIEFSELEAVAAYLRSAGFSSGGKGKRVVNSFVKGVWKRMRPNGQTFWLVRNKTFNSFDDACEAADTGASGQDSQESA